MKHDHTFFRSRTVWMAFAIIFALILSGCAVPHVTVLPSPTPRLSATVGTPTSIRDEEIIWREVSRSAREVSPILRPRSLPPGLETLEMRRVGSPQGEFWVEYSGPGKSLRILVGAWNPPYWKDGWQRRATVRGQNAILQVKSSSQPSELVQVYWDEPGSWIAGPGAPIKDRVFYIVAGEGFDPEVVLQLANSLSEMDRPLE